MSSWNEVTIRSNPLGTVAKELQTTIGSFGTARLSPLAWVIGCDVCRATRTAWLSITLDSHAIGESMRHEQEVRMGPDARCSECGHAMQVEKMSIDVMMMWRRAHCDLAPAYFTDEDIFETSGDFEKKKSASIATEPRRRAFQPGRGHPPPSRRRCSSARRAAR